MALLYFRPAPEGWRGWRWKVDEVEVDTWAADTPQDKTLRLFVVAKVDLSERPALNEDREILVPQGPLKQAEAAIESAANLIAICERCKRSISSPVPSVAFLPEDQASRDWLASTNGIFRSGNIIVDMGGFSVDSEALAELGRDRLDGVALLAEALAHEHPTGEFHELMRVFERAFALGPYELIEPLTDFLEGAEKGYTRTEVERWLTVIRHPTTHADRRPDFVLESDTRPVIPRIKQAAYDVLFNKASWRAKSTKRRDLWCPPAGTGGEHLHIYLTQGKGAEMAVQFFDEVGSYPADLGAGVWNMMPPDWWSEWPEEKSPLEKDS